MAKGYSKDFRERVVALVEDGDSAREAARLLNIGAATAIRWVDRWTSTGTYKMKSALLSDAKFCTRIEKSALPSPLVSPETMISVPDFT
jgi:transposase-like protein